MEKKADRLWKELSRIPTNELDEISKSFYQFPSGTNRRKIWDWFETKFKINISDLRYPKKTHKKETHYVCCGFFEKTIRYYQWFELIEGDKLLLVMPCFPDTKTRVNYCPVCGKHIRDVEFDEETFKKYV